MNEQNMGQHGEPGRQVSAKAAFCDPDTYHHIWNENFRAKRTNGEKDWNRLKEKKKKEKPKDSLNKTHPALAPASLSACHMACDV